ncbi:MAG: ABC transporter ATP-binding protein, partial [Bdellovibrionales bacterium]|nr:ABC transporter ATP-binding protein [Bdellovibrionales bacterium]
MNKNSPALEISNFVYEYSSDWSGKKIRAVNDISLTVQAGESFGFLGHNGAGKTTTIKAILGLSTPTSGTIRIFGKANTHPDARTDIGYLPEQPYFYDHLTVTELVEMYAHLAGIPSTEVRKATQIALERVHVSGRSKSPLRSLSKGLTQRVGMAQAIVHRPKLLILDEPFSGLDPIGRKEFKDLLFALKQEGAAIFISSHILEDIEFLCDRASIMAHGEIKLILSLDRLSEHVERHYELTIEEPFSERGEIEAIATSTDQQGSSVYLRFNSRESAEEALVLALESGAPISRYNAAHGN